MFNIASELLSRIPRLALLGPATTEDFRFALARLPEIARGAATGDFSGFQEYLRAIFTLSDGALRELTSSECAKLFDDAQADIAGIPAFSLAGDTQWPDLSPVLVLPELILRATKGRNDGLVPLSSASLQHKHVANLATDHLGLVGWRPLDVSPQYHKIFDTLRANESAG